MNFSELTDRLFDLINGYWGRFQESSLFNKFKEQYDSWPIIVQRAAVFTSGFLLVFVVLSIPLAYIDSASIAIEEFTEYRSLIRELIRVGRTADEPPPLPAGLSFSDMQSQAQMILSQSNLVEEQMGTIQPLDNRPAAILAPPVIKQEGISVQLKKLNLNQVVEIGYRLQELTRGTKLTGIDISANATDDHYYDVVYKIVNFSLPMTTMALKEPPGGREQNKDDEQ